MCAGSTDFYLAGLAALSGDTAVAARHYRAAISCHRRLGARPMLARTLHEYSLLPQEPSGTQDLPAASAALAEAGAIATECGMTTLLDLLDQPRTPVPGTLALNRDGDYWLIGYGDALVRAPDSLGLRYLDLLIRNPGRELPALELVQLAAATGGVTAGIQHGDLHDVSGAAADDILDPQARAAYRHRLAELDTELTEADQWHDTERASRLRAEKDFLLRELAAATGLGGRPRQLGSESERARLNVTRAIRSAISRLRDRAPAAAAHLDQAIRTGSRCCYLPAGPPARAHPAPSPRNAGSPR
jgi:hypothetical protein